MPAEAGLKGFPIEAMARRAKPVQEQEAANHRPARAAPDRGGLRGEPDALERGP